MHAEVRGSTPRLSMILSGCRVAANPRCLGHRDHRFESDLPDCYGGCSREDQATGCGPVYAGSSPADRPNVPEGALLSSHGKERAHGERLCLFGRTLFWARCLLEWVTVCNTAAFVHEGSSPSAPTRIRLVKCVSGCTSAVRRPVSGTGSRGFESRCPASSAPIVYGLGFLAFNQYTPVSLFPISFYPIFLRLTY